MEKGSKKNTVHRGRQIIKIKELKTNGQFCKDKENILSARLQEQSSLWPGHFILDKNSSVVLGSPHPFYIIDVRQVKVLLR